MDEGEAPIGDDEMIRDSRNFFKSTVPHVIGRGERMLHQIEDLCGVFLSLSNAFLTLLCCPFMGLLGVVLWLNALGRCPSKASIL